MRREVGIAEESNARNNELQLPKPIQFEIGEGIYCSVFIIGVGVVEMGKAEKKNRNGAWLVQK